eukprot:TRINITY_DN62711_c0_g1_i1.p1 TRINITY_DN62711_c0_g1~~TRINITY_DN62711_c0_g1_i1.p1  ORF type:complete len:518 (-),score=41.17 TRINITY_DN62711_c0_g1_i1:298-1815(-)
MASAPKCTRTYFSGCTCSRAPALGACILLFLSGQTSVAGSELRGTEQLSQRLSTWRDDWITDGVNVGSWLHLEDWFFSSDNGRFVSTPDTEPGQGHCLPPLLKKLDVPWRSEGSLAHFLNATRGSQDTAAVFKAHRETFFTPDDLKNIRDLGVKYVRVPINWAAFADSIEGLDDPAYRSHNPDKDTAIVPDPYYSSEIAFATVPRDFLAEFLRNCSAMGLGVVLDLHAFPGGSAWGTFNGITPLTPVFWHEAVRLQDGSMRNLTDIGLQVVEGLVEWCKSLDPVAQSAIEGLTMMNEPALFVYPKPDIILSWLESSANFVRRAKADGALPNVKLYVNLHEKGFDEFEKHVVPWWHTAFTREERFSWVVFDLHYYVAWNPSCTGTIHGNTQWGPAKFMCNESVKVVQEVFDGCVDEWAAYFANTFEGLRTSTETSAGTWFDTSIACSNPAVTNSLGHALTNKMRNHNISSFFWSWRMPHGKRYKPGWSLAHLKGYGIEPSADECIR